MSFIKQLGLNAANSVASQLTGTIGNTLSALMFGGFKGLKNMVRGSLSTGLTSAQKEANAWTANREDTAYQRSVADMQAAGLNPALMYGSAGSTSPSASTSPSDGASLSEMLGSATALSQIQSMEVQNEVSQKQVAIAQQNADTSRFNAETERMSVEQGIEESKSRISLNKVEELYKQSGIALNEKQVEKITAQINDLNSQVSYREAQIVLQTIESQIKQGQLKVNESYLKLAWEKWNEGEKAECLAHIALMQQQEMEAYYSGLEKNSLASLHTQQRKNLVSQNRRDEEYHRFIIPHMRAELEEKKRQFKEELIQQLKIAKMQVDQAEINAIMDGLFSTVNTGISTFGNLAGGAIPPVQATTTTVQRDVYHKGVKVGTNSRKSTTYN